jgi:hypothetical protein
MYSLTIDGPQVATLRAALTTPTTWRRIYRWEDKWGMLKGDVWNAEIRTPVVSVEPNYLLESVAGYPTNAPPPNVDEMGGEEGYSLPYGTCGNVLVIQGTLADIKRICASKSITLPPAILEYSASKDEVKEPVGIRGYSAPRGTIRGRGTARGRGAYRGVARTHTPRNVCLIVDTQE